MDIRDAALEYIAEGFAVLPLRAKAKEPASAHGVHDATLDTLQVSTWNEEWNVGIAVPDGRVVIDVDPRNGGDESFNRLSDDIDLPFTWESKTGSGGQHLMYNVPAGLPLKNGKLDGYPGIDVKVKGGYIVAPPSMHPNGTRYTMKDGQRDIVDCPPELLALLPRKYADNGTVYTGGLVGDNDPRPGGVYNRKATWEQVLEPHGWHKTGQGVDGVVHWCRPGKDAGISATTGYQGLDVLYVFTTSTEFESEAAYNKFAAHTILNHGGDYAASAGDLADQGYKTTTPVEGASVEPYSYYPAASSESFLGRYVAYAHAQTDAPRQYHEAAGLSLLALSTRLARGVLPPYPGGLATNLYVLLCGTTTRSRKSTSQRIARDLIDAAFPVALLPGRTTAEALISKLAQRDNQATMWMPDEFGVLLGQVYKRDGYMAAVEEVALTIYGGEKYTYETIGRGAIHILAPHFNILAAATPESLAMAGPGAMVSGLLPRFAIVLPAGLPDPRPVSATTFDVEGERTALIAHLKEVRTWSAQNPTMTFSPEALETLNDEESKLAVGGPATARLPTMLYKVAMLSAASRMSNFVSVEDAVVACYVIGEWARGSRRLRPHLAKRSRELGFEAIMQSAHRSLMQLDGEADRRLIAQKVSVPKRQLDEIEETLEDRGLIGVSNEGGVRTWRNLA